MAKQTTRFGKAGKATVTLRDAVVNFLKDRFDLRDDQAYEGETIETVRRDVQFRGANLWILLFAILICSIGLNVNSPAVVIGAMLISPLMGPILGIGVGVAVYDFDLLLTALKNLAIATAASVFVSSVYFGISPITEAQSELLARVSPTLWDVLVATFGGFAGIIAVSRKEKGNALPGVAIATALMPPICTAGYAIAQNNWKYFFGSLYLFFINVVFIAVATFLLARFMRFTKQQFVDDQQERNVRRWITLIVAIVAIPSIYTAYNTVERSIYLQRASRYVDQVCSFEGAEVVSRRITGAKDNDARTIELVLIGKGVRQSTIDSAAARMAEYQLHNTELIVMQDEDDAAVTPGQLRLMQQLLANERIYRGRASVEVLPEGEDTAVLKALIEKNRYDSTLYSEVETLVPQLQALDVAELEALGPAAYRSDSLRRPAVAVRLMMQNPIGEEQREQLRKWLTVRLQSDTTYLLIDYPVQLGEFDL